MVPTDEWHIRGEHWQGVTFEEKLSLYHKCTNQWILFSPTTDPPYHSLLQCILTTVPYNQSSSFLPSASFPLAVHPDTSCDIKLIKKALPKECAWFSKHMYNIYCGHLTFTADPLFEIPCPPCLNHAALSMPSFSEGFTEKIWSVHVGICDQSA